MFKVVWFGRFREGLSAAEGRSHWRETHGPLGRGVPQIAVYVQSHATSALGAVGEAGGRPAFDGYSCCWYADEGSFLIRVRCRLEWDWDAFRRLTSAMYDVADAAKGQPSIETWIAEGFWYCDTFIRDWTSHPNFPRPPEKAYQDALELLNHLASFLFTGLNPYKDDTTLRKKAKG